MTGRGKSYRGNTLRGPMRLAASAVIGFHFAGSAFTGFLLAFRITISSSHQHFRRRDVGSPGGSPRPDPRSQSENPSDGSPKVPRRDARCRGAKTSQNHAAQSVGRTLSTREARSRPAGMDPATGSPGPAPRMGSGAPMSPPRDEGVRAREGTGSVASPRASPPKKKTRDGHTAHGKIRPDPASRRPEAFHVRPETSTPSRTWGVFPSKMPEGNLIGEPRRPTSLGRLARTEMCAWASLARQSVHWRRDRRRIPSPRPKAGSPI